jgi:hypothetical protein
MNIARTFSDFVQTFGYRIEFFNSIDGVCFGVAWGIVGNEG